MTWFDLLLILILLLSIGFAMIRGAIRELATLAALGGAAFVAYLLFHPIIGALKLESSIFGMIGVASALIAIFFIGLYILFHFGLKQLHLTPQMARADRVGGAGFGLLRGLAVIGLGFLGYAYYADEEHRPDAVNDAMLLPMAQASANFFEGLAPQHDSEKIITPDQIDKQVDAANDGYGRGERAALNEIVLTATTSDQAAASSSSNNDADPIADILIEEQRQ